MLDRKPCWERYWDGAQYWCESLGEVLAEHVLNLAESSGTTSSGASSNVAVRRNSNLKLARSQKRMRRVVGKLAVDVEKQRREAAGSYGPWGEKGQEELECFRKHLRKVIFTLETIVDTLDKKGNNPKNGENGAKHLSNKEGLKQGAVSNVLNEEYIDNEVEISSESSSESEDENNAYSEISPDKLVGWGEVIEEDCKGPKTLEKNHEIKTLACNGHRGLYATCAGDVYSFGDSGTGMPPDVRAAKNITRNSPRVVPELVLERVLMGQRVIVVACGFLHSVAVTQGGRLWSWGCGQDGRLGHGDEEDQITPRLCVALADMHVRAVGCGGVHTIAVVSPSKVYSWGLGRRGRLGLGDGKSYSTPQLVNVDDHALAMSQAYHALFGCKLPKEVKKDCDEPIKSVACGWGFTILLGANGTVRAFGAGEDGQCGIFPSKDQLLPTIVKFHDPSAKVSVRKKQAKIVQVSCGYHHAVAVDSAGQVWSWGYGGSGQLGQGANITLSPTPKVVRWEKGRIGNEESENIRSFDSTTVENDTTAVNIEPFKCRMTIAGQFHSVCILQNGSTWGWGSNEHGAVTWKESDEYNNRKSVYVPTRLDIDSVVEVAAGAHYTIAVVRKESPTSKTSESLAISHPEPGESIQDGISCTYCGGRIYYWHVSMETYLPRIGVLTSSGMLEMYKDLSSTDPLECFPIYCGPHLSVNQWHNIVEIWRTYPGWEFTLLVRFKANSVKHAQEWKRELLRKKMTAPPPPLEPRPANGGGSNIFDSWGYKKVDPNKKELLSWSSLSLSDLRPNTQRNKIQTSIGSPSERRSAWKSLIGNALKVTPELFLIYKERAQATRQDGIGMDVKRTLPRLLLFGKRGEPLYEQLRDVLEVYRCYRPDVGYVQGMSYVAAMLCLHIPDNEFECFMCLANLLASHNCFDFFRLGQSYNRIEFIYEITDLCLEKNSKKVFRHLKKIDGLLDIHTVYFQQFQTLFVRNLPLEQATLLWDLFLRDGTITLIRAAVALLLLLEPKILQIDFSGELMRLLLPQYKGQDLFKKLQEVVVPNQCLRMLEKLN